MGTGEEPILADIGMRTGETPVLRAEAGDSCFEDYPGDDFEKVREITPEETPQSPSDPVPEIRTEETSSSAEPRRKRIKTLAGRTDLPWVRKLIAQRSQTSPSSPILSQTAYPTNPKIPPFSCSRVCAEE